MYAEEQQQFEVNRRVGFVSLPACLCEVLDRLKLLMQDHKVIRRKVLPRQRLLSNFEMPCSGHDGPCMWSPFANTSIRLLTRCCHRFFELAPKGSDGAAGLGCLGIPHTITIVCPAVCKAGVGPLHAEQGS